MQGRTVLAMLPGSGPLQRLQVSLAQRCDGRLTIDLREQHYAEGIGWFDQRALELDPRQVRELQAVLGAQSSRLAASERESPMTIPFPGPSVRESVRPAVGQEG
jgi:hypothetical protein